MEEPQKIKQLLKILIGAAWIDGTIQPEEREYLHRTVREFNLADEREIKLLLSEVKPVKPAECYRWLEEYLGDRPTQEDYLHLLEAISALVYSDRMIHTEEAKLLSKLHNLQATTSNSASSPFDKALKGIQKLYKLAISEKT